MRPLILGLVAVSLIAGPVRAASTPYPKGEAKLAKALEGRVMGQPVDCIDPHNVETVEIIDRTAILYRMPGGGLYVNRPSAGAADLEWDTTLTTRTVGARLCNHDTMMGSRFGGTSFLMLGPFTPYGRAAR